ncbi:XisH family protein [Spirulina sp. 06S082]|uniref:XisH family protein n=1 Tax=Spirulina sp. 06S082 TaxID=3110248 RepID=UPI002B2105EB|nr:XisH family protein [Spirulina sp. 06S082]MEA5469229.1 XisH family protein [Spirulina sp. 06S082]
MSAKDIFHDAVRNALEKEGWRITHDPMFISIGGVQVYIDLGADKIVEAERNGEKIAVEIKSFVGTSAISEFHKALGQYITYRFALEEQESDRPLYLAVPLGKYKEFFELPLIQKIIQGCQVNLIVYDPAKEEIIQWKK